MQSFVQMVGTEIEAIPKVYNNTKDDYSCNICHLPTKGTETVTIELKKSGKWFRTSWYHKDCCNGKVPKSTMTINVL